MAGDVVVVGASAGGVEALRALCAGLPVDFPAPVVVVLHIPRSAPSALPAILGRAGPLSAVPVEKGTPLRDGVLHVAPADRHVLISSRDGLDRLHLSAGPSENGHRPAIDPLFRSAAATFGPRAVGLVLSGTRDDGTAGLLAIAEQRGAALVQDPADALYQAMPRSALEHVPGARAYPAAKLGGVLSELLADPDRARVARPEYDELLRAEVDMASMTGQARSTAQWDGAEPSGFSCPNCDGVLFELPGGPPPRFRCRVGHAWSPQSLSSAQEYGADGALWKALRALEEKASLLRRLADHAGQGGHHRSAAAYQCKADETDSGAARVRELIRGTSGDAERA